MTNFEQAWQSLFDALPVHERLEIVSNPKGERAARHAKDALLMSEGKLPAVPTSDDQAKPVPPKETN